MEFRLLGPLEVEDGGRRVPLGGGKQRALLALLLVHAGDVLSVERLIDELWGEYPPATAAKTLQVHVSRLRKALAAGGGDGDGAVATRAGGYQLAVDRGKIDSCRFEWLVAEGRRELAAERPEDAAGIYEEALALWRGTPLADVAEEPFARTEIGRLSELRLDAQEQLAEAKLALGRHAEVVPQLEALASEHPYRERLRGQLMLALYRCDRQAEALQAYQDARRALVEDLGIEPGQRLRELERAILAHDPALGLALDSAPQEPARAPLAGRQRELRELTAGLDQVLAGHGQLFLLAGEPGIGKSRLAEELAVRARERGAMVLVGRCWEAGGAPAYWPWVQSLRAYVREAEPVRLRSQVAAGGGELAKLLPELRELFPPMAVPQEADSEGGRFRLFEATSAFLRAVAADRPLTLLLDDLHAADASTLLLLRFVAGELAGAPIFIVACYRDAEVGPELAEALEELARRPSVARLALRGLEEAETARLLELAMARRPPGGLSERVHLETQGNPLFAAEIGRLLASRPAPEPGDGPLPIPDGVREAIGLRLERQSEGCRAVLTLASVIGREFGIEELQRVSGLDEGELFNTLEEASAARLVGAVPGSSTRLRFSHILVRDALYSALPPPRRMLLHRDAGDALEALYAGGPEAHLAALAHHYLEAGSLSTAKAAGYSERAGDTAAAQLAYEEAVRHYASALRVLAATGSGDERRTCALLLAQGDVLSRAGRGEEARDAFRRAAGTAEASGWPDELARAALGYGGRFSWARAATDPHLVPLLERALAAVGEADSPKRVKLLIRLAGALRDDPSRDRRFALAEEALAMARRLGDPETLAGALEGHVAFEGPDTAAAGASVEAGEELVSLARAIGDKEREYEGHDCRLHGFWWLADRVGMDVEVDALTALAEDLRQPAHTWWADACRTALALMEGRLDDAERLIPATLAVGEDAQRWNALVSHRLALFVLRREQGRLNELEDDLRRWPHEFPALLRFRCALVHALAELGHQDEAQAILADLITQDLGRLHVDSEWLFAMALLPDAVETLGDERAARAVYEVLRPWERLYSNAPAEAAFGSIARALAVLATTLGRYDDAERHIGVALEIEQRMRARPWVAHATRDLAQARLSRAAPGDEESALELFEEAARRYRELGMQTWTARAEGRGGQGGLGSAQP